MILSPIFPAGSGRLPRKKKKGFYLQTYGVAGTQTSPIAAESLCSCCLEAGRGRRLICVYLQVRRGSTGFPGGMDAASFFLKSGAGADDVPPGDLSFPDHMEEIVTEGDPFSRLIRLPDEAEKNKKELPGRREYMRSMYEMELEIMKEKAYKEGYEEGYKEGLKLALIEMVKSRIRKGLDPETAAKQLMREEEVIRPIYDMILAMPEASEEEILEALEKQEAQK